MAKTIRQECSEQVRDKEVYNTHISVEQASEACSDLLMNLLAALSPKLDHTNTAYMIGNIVTGAVSKKPTDLQISLGTVLREKTLIEQFYEFGVVCSYDEVLRFKTSVAHAAAQNRNLQGLMDSKVGLVQTIADNFDANISSANGLKSTHALALLVTQIDDDKADLQKAENLTIRRLSKDEMRDDPAKPVILQHYNGPKKPVMPETSAVGSVLPLRVLAAKVISAKRAESSDFDFLQQILFQDMTPEYNGFNTRLSREQGHAVKPKTKAIYTPLIDMKPSDPDTIMTAMVEAQQMTQTINQSTTPLTLDQQQGCCGCFVDISRSVQVANPMPRRHAYSEFCWCYWHLDVL